jgi:hypothetical protein
MNTYLSVEHQQFQEVFFENLDNWSVIKCFEKGFECFYQSLAQKGVISVNKNNSRQSSSAKKMVQNNKENTMQAQKQMQEY